ncbi:transcription regulator, partial [Tanacetum coccineum]
VATEFAISLVRRLVASDSRVISKLHPLVDALAKLATRPDASEALRRQLVEITRSLSGSSFGLPSSKYDFPNFVWIELFMEPFLRNADLGEPVCFLYKGTLRVPPLLLHDIIPPSCLQIRNIVLKNTIDVVPSEVSQNHSDSKPPKQQIVEPVAPNKLDAPVKTEGDSVSMSNVEKQKMSEYGNCKNEKSALEEKLMRLESDLMDGTRLQELLTPLGTPLFPSLEMESHKTVMGQTGTPKGRPTALKSRVRVIFCFYTG